jgi:hypothetical protein
VIMKRVLCSEMHNYVVWLIVTSVLE